MDKWSALAALVSGETTRRHDEHGDVPGWVLVTVMTAGLVVGLWAVADDALGQMLRDALAQVH